ncbi:MAG: SCO family protein [Methylophilaceae bacterium]
MSFLTTVDDQGHASNLSQLAKDQHKVLITQFIYTRCRTLCLSLGDTFQQAQTQITNRKLTQQLGLASISFDVDNENTKSLQAYRQRMHADPQVWSLLKIQNAQVLDTVKRKLGLMVIEDQQKDFVHNSAFLVISPQGHLVGIFDPADIDNAIELALKKWQVKPSNTVS